MTLSGLIVTIDIGPAFAWLCRYDGDALRVEREPGGPIAEAWPRWMKRLEVNGPHAVICRINAETLLDPVELTSLARSAGATSVRIIRDEPDCDPAMAIVRQLGDRMNEREVCFAELRAARGCCGIIDPAGRVITRHDGQIEPNGSLSEIISAKLREQLGALARPAARDKSKMPLLVAYGQIDSALAVRVAEAGGVNRVLIPHHAAALPAIGMLIADIILDYRRELVPGPIDIPAMRRAFAELMDQANDEVTRLGYDVDNTICTRRAALACTGDSSSIEVSCESIPDAGTVLALFNSARAEAGKREVSESSAELRAVGIRVAVDTPKNELPLATLRLTREKNSLHPNLPQLGAGWTLETVADGIVLSCQCNQGLG